MVHFRALRLPTQYGCYESPTRKQLASRLEGLQEQLYFRRFFQSVRQRADVGADVLHDPGFRSRSAQQQRLHAGDADAHPDGIDVDPGFTGVGALTNHGAYQQPA